MEFPKMFFCINSSSFDNDMLEKYELDVKQPQQEPIRTTEGSFKGTLGKLPKGIDKKESHYAQEIISLFSIKFIFNNCRFKFNILINFVCCRTCNKALFLSITN